MEISGGDVFQVVDLTTADLESCVSAEVASFGHSDVMSGSKRKSVIKVDVSDPHRKPHSNIEGPIAIITDTEGFVIMHPDVLMSPTAISEAVTCAAQDSIRSASAHDG